MTEAAWGHEALDVLDVVIDHEFLFGRLHVGCSFAENTPLGIIDLIAVVGVSGLKGGAVLVDLESEVFAIPLPGRLGVVGYKKIPPMPVTFGVVSRTAVDKEPAAWDSAPACLCRVGEQLSNNAARKKRKIFAFPGNQRL